jgi:hypothetical protein
MSDHICSGVGMWDHMVRVARMRTAVAAGDLS